MARLNRRKFIQLTAQSGVALALGNSLIERALSVRAYNRSKTIKDVQHVVILMQENRSFDHYFGTLRGVRGFGDRFPIPLESGKRVFEQSDGKKIIPPYHADHKTSNAALIQGTPHNFPDMQAAWNQGKYGYWPLYKTPYSMAYYTREEVPFQYALAEAFTISDAYFCSVATGTDPNRIVFWSGSNFDPKKREAGENCTDEFSEPVNLRCWIKGTMPEPGYTYQGNAFTWPTIPDVLQKAGISWRIYQDPNNNWTGAMHGCLAFESFRNAKPGDPIYENGMRHWSLEQLKQDVLDNKLPQVVWVLPSQDDSEHPGAPSSPYRGADFTHRVLDAITSNPDVWSKTVFFLTFDENDGLFDHLPAPAVPSYNLDGTLAGKSTIDLRGMYFINEGGPDKKNYLNKRDTLSGNIRPWGFGPRVPLYIISPWSKGGWVDSQIADHTSVGQFLEKRFNIEIPAISPWHRAVSSDLLSAFDFVTPNDPEFPKLPPTSDYPQKEAASKQKPKAIAPENPSPLFQEKGARYSRALPYVIHTDTELLPKEKQIRLHFINEGKAGVVFHVYDLHHLDRIPRRYTVEAGKSLSDEWIIDEKGYDLEVFGPNGYFRKFKSAAKAAPHISLRYEKSTATAVFTIENNSRSSVSLALESEAYRYPGPKTLTLKPGEKKRVSWPVGDNGNWYDLTIAMRDQFLHRYAGRIENGKHTISDPAMAAHL